MCASMRNIRFIVWFLLATAFVGATDNATISARRRRAASAFHDGILIVHAVSRFDLAADGYRQDPYFYYLTGLENTIGALLAIDGKSGEAWLFLPDHPPYQKRGCSPRCYRGRMPPSVWASIVWWTGLNSMAFCRGRPARAPAFTMPLMLLNIPNCRPIF